MAGLGSAIPSDSALRMPDGTVRQEFIPNTIWYTPLATFNYFFGPNVPAIRRRVDLVGWIRDFYGYRPFMDGSCERCLIFQANCTRAAPGGGAGPCNLCSGLGIACLPATDPRPLTPDHSADPAAAAAAAISKAVAATAAVDAQRMIDATRAAAVGGTDVLLPLPLFDPRASAGAPPDTGTPGGDDKGKGKAVSRPSGRIPLPPSHSRASAGAPPDTGTPGGDDKGKGKAAGTILPLPPFNSRASSGAPPDTGPPGGDDKGKGEEVVPHALLARDRCNSCEQRGLTGCTADADRDMGCVQCKHLDELCVWGNARLRPVPDGLMRPLCCDQCITRSVAGCSWRAQDADYHLPCSQCREEGSPCTHIGVQCTRLWGKRHTHMLLTRNIRVANMNERSSRQQWTWDDGGARGRGRSASPPRDTGRTGRRRTRQRSIRRRRSPSPASHYPVTPVAPVPQPTVPAPFRSIAGGTPAVPPPAPSMSPSASVNDVYPRPGPVTHIDKRRRYGVYGPTDPHSKQTGFLSSRHCLLCANRLTPRQQHCDVDTKGDENGEGRHGCRFCVLWGVVCSVKVSKDPTNPMHEPLPPHPNNLIPRNLRRAACNACRDKSRSCDRKTPCDSCIRFGDDCTRTTSAGCFKRGVSGDDLPNYYLLQGYGPGGVNDYNPILLTNYRTPVDLHLQYLQKILDTRPELLVDLGMRAEYRNNPARSPTPAPPVPDAPNPDAPGPSAPGPAAPGPAAPGPSASSPETPGAGAPGPGASAAGTPAASAPAAGTPAAGTPAPDPNSDGVDDWVPPGPDPADTTTPPDDLMSPEDLFSMLSPGAVASILSPSPAPQYDLLPPSAIATSTTDPNVPRYNPVTSSGVSPPADMGAPTESERSLYYAALVQELADTQAQAQALGDPVIINTLAGYREALAIALELSRSAIDFPHDNIFMQLQQDITEGAAAHESPGIGMIRHFMELARQRGGRVAGGPHHEQPIRSPPSLGIDEALLEMLNPTSRPIRYADQDEPVQRPFSPGPIVPVFDFGRGIEVARLHAVDNSALYPDGHPERVDIARVTQLPEHPNPRGRPLLADVPLNIAAEPDPTTIDLSKDKWAVAYPPRGGGIDGLCAEIRDDGIACENFTLRRCESKWHWGQEPVCDDCDAASKERLYRVWALSPAVQELRAYVCRQCLPQAADPESFHASGFRVWGLQPDAESSPESAIVTNASPNIYLDRPGVQRTVTKGGFMGPDPLPVTGCACGLKLFGRRLCTPHRTQHVIDMQEAAVAMRTYVLNAHGKMVCPLCRVNRGVDAYDFAGPEGGEGQRLAWACLACHAFVVAGVADSGLIPGAYEQLGVQAAMPDHPVYPDPDTVMSM